MNPTNTISWNNLINHYNDIKNTNIKHLFEIDSQRFDKYSIETSKIFLDYSKNILNDHIMSDLIYLAKEMNIEQYIDKLFHYNSLNISEDRPVLHTALRDVKFSKILVDNKDISIEILRSLNKIKKYSEDILNGNWKGYSGKIITDIVNIGIGGSSLGPNMVIDALKNYKTRLNIHFVSNMDPSQIYDILLNLNPETTLFIICSKTFTTDETISNAEYAKSWFYKYSGIKNLSNHFLAITVNIDAAICFGIIRNNIFEFWEWVGGRFSLWGPVGLSIALSIGYNNFKELLNGAYYMDKHFRTRDLNHNIPVILALIGIWYNNFYNYKSLAIIPYDNYLKLLPKFLQQLEMESNGKSVDKEGNKVNYNTCPIIWGEVATDSQHSFFQLLHQGTTIVPCDFIASVNNKNNIEFQNKKLFSNFLGQSNALAFGNYDLQSFNLSKKNFLSSFKHFPGNRPSNSILYDKLNPNVLGQLIAIYEHKVFVQGIIWNILSFDQWGVELGKKISKNIYLNMNNDSFITDNSTKGLINIYNKWKEN